MTPSQTDQEPGSSNQAVPVAAILGANSVASDLAAIVTGRFGMAFLSFVAALMTTRMLGPVGYGTVAIVAILSNLVFTVSTSWTGVSIRRYGREDLEIRGSMSRTTWNRVLIGAPSHLDFHLSCPNAKDFPRAAFRA